MARRLKESADPEAGQQFKDLMSSLTEKAKSLQAGTPVVVMTKARLSPQHFQKAREKYSDRERHYSCFAIFDSFIPGVLPAVMLRIQDQSRTLPLTQIEVLEKVDVDKLSQVLNDLLWTGKINRNMRIYTTQPKT